MSKYAIMPTLPLPKSFCMINPKPTQLIDAPHIFAGAKLQVDAHWRDGADTLALILHPNPKAGGTMDNKVITTLYRFCREQGMSVVRFNYRGVGASDGQVEYGQGEFLDSICVLRWALAQTTATRLWLAGFSFGGYVACCLADEMLTNPAYDEVLQKLTLIAPSIEKNDPTGLTLPADTVMIYGSQDEYVTPDNMAKFAERFDIRQKVMEDATHFFHGRLGELSQLLEI